MANRCNGFIYEGSFLPSFDNPVTLWCPRLFMAYITPVIVEAVYVAHLYPGHYLVRIISCSSI